MILDLDKDVFSGTLQNNLKSIYNTYGSQFSIKYNDKIDLHVKLFEYITLSGRKYFEIQGYMDCFNIDFYDNSKIGSNVYISYIHKLDDPSISGSDIVRFVLKFLKKLNTKKAYLIDRASVECKGTNTKMDLSIIKILTNGLTFYTKLGFKLFLGYVRSPEYKLSDKQIIEHLNINLDIIRNIKISDILHDYKNIKKIINSVVITGKYDKLKIKLLDIYDPGYYDYNNNPDYFIDDNVANIKNLFSEIQIIEPILIAGKKYRNLRDLIISLATTQCTEFVIFQKFFLKSDATEILFDKIYIERPYIKAYYTLYKINNESRLVYIF